MKVCAPLATFVALAAGSASALTPPMPCDGVESGMRTSSPVDLASGSGLVVENYWRDGGGGQIEALKDFYGVRVTHCASGQFVAIGQSTDSVERVAAALGATEFMRAKVQAGRRVTANEMKQASKAVYGDVLLLKETEETCGCNWLYPDLRPKGMTSWDQRGN